MMNFWKTFILAMVVAVGVAACAVEDEELATGAGEGAEVSDPAVPGAEDPQVVTVPDELSFDLLSEGTINGNSFTAQACYVALVYCRDASHYNLPSYCQNGGCTATRALEAAYSLCKSRCGAIRCNVLYNRGRC